MPGEDMEVNGHVELKTSEVEQGTLAPVERARVDALVARRLQLLADAMLRSADVMRHMIGGNASLRRVASP